MLSNLKEFEPEKLEPEIVYRLPTARLVFADHELLQHDFPQVRKDSLEKWLLTNAAFISENQRSQSRVNSTIETTDEQVMAFRPSDYGRALIFSLEVNRSWGIEVSGTNAIEGLLDVKGTGVAPLAMPRFGTHFHGLLSLGEGIREIIVEKLLNRIFQHSGSSCRTVPSYGLIDTGFDLKWKNGMRAPAGMLVRRAHLRPVYRSGMKDSSSHLVDLELDIELLLRRYGITSNGVATTIEIAKSNGTLAIKYGGTLLQCKEDDIKTIEEMVKFDGRTKRLEGVNLQFTRQTNPHCPQLVDFGGFLVKEKFENAIVSLVVDRLLRLGKIISTSDPRFVQPDNRIRLPYELWGETGRIWEYSASEMELSTLGTDNARTLAYNLAREFREGKLTGDDVRNKIEEYLMISTSHW